MISALPVSNAVVRVDEMPSTMSDEGYDTMMGAPLFPAAQESIDDVVPGYRPNVSFADM